MAGEQWYYVQAGQRLGPVPVETLRSLISAGAVNTGDLVWTEGMADWVAAATVPGVAAAPRPVPPPAHLPPVQPQRNPPPQYATPQYATPQYAQPHAQEQYGTPAHGGYAQAVNYYAPPNQRVSSYAGFWLRFIAFIIDGVILGVLFAIFFAALAALTGLSLMSSSHVTAEQVGMAVVLWYGSSLVLPWLYFALMESSASQGTPGKRALGLRVTNMEGGRVSFGQATGRYFGRILSSFFCIGYLMAGLTERKQALHDILAGCLVIQG